MQRKIDDLMKAEIVYESGDTKLLKYKDLKELNDKLVLISGQQNYHEKVLSFTQVSWQFPIVHFPLVSLVVDAQSRSYGHSLIF